MWHAPRRARRPLTAHALVSIGHGADNLLQRRHHQRLALLLALPPVPAALGHAKLLIVTVGSRVCMQGVR